MNIDAYTIADLENLLNTLKTNKMTPEEIFLKIRELEAKISDTQQELASLKTQAVKEFITDKPTQPLASEIINLINETELSNFPENHLVFLTCLSQIKRMCQGIRIETKPTEKWKPTELGEKYFCFSSYLNEIVSTTFIDADSDRERLEAGNCFQTKEECEAWAKNPYKNVEDLDFADLIIFDGEIHIYAENKPHQTFRVLTNAEYLRYQWEQAQKKEPEKCVDSKENELRVGDWVGDSTGEIMQIEKGMLEIYNTGNFTKAIVRPFNPLDRLRELANEACEKEKEEGVFQIGLYFGQFLIQRIDTICFGTICFPSIKSAQDAINEIGKDVLIEAMKGGAE